MKTGTYHLPMLLFTKDSMDTEIPMIVRNIPPLSFLGTTTKKVITGNMKVAWDPEILVEVVTEVGVTSVESLSDIGINAINEVVGLE